MKMKMKMKMEGTCSRVLNTNPRWKKSCHFNDIFASNSKYKRNSGSGAIFCLARSRSAVVTTRQHEKKEQVEMELPDTYSPDINSPEGWIEKIIYRCRFMAFLGIIGSLMGSIICFLKGCVYVANSFSENFLISGPGGGKVISMLIEAIDVYLIGTVMLVFGMGLYELFISNMDIEETSSRGSNLLGLFRLTARPKWLEIKSVNELKTKLGHVIVMVLLIGLFEKSKKIAIHTSTDLFCFAASILLSSGCLFLLSKLHTDPDGEGEHHAPNAA